MPFYFVIPANAGIQFFVKGDPLEMLDCLQGQYINLSPECTEELNTFKWNYPKPAK